MFGIATYELRKTSTLRPTGPRVAIGIASAAVATIVVFAIAWLALLAILGTMWLASLIGFI